MKHFFVACFLLLSITGIAETFPKKYVDSLTAVALSKKTTHPLLLNRDSAMIELWKTKDPADRIAIFYDITNSSDELSPKRSEYYHNLILDGARKRGDKVLEAVVLAEVGFRTSRNGNTAAGLKMIYASVEKAEATGNAQALGIAYDNLGNSYPNNIKLSRQYLYKALDYSLKGNDFPFACINLIILGRQYLSEQKRDSALVLYLKCYRLAVDKNLETLIPSALLYLSDLDTLVNRPQYYRQASLMPFVIRNLGMKNNLNYQYANYYLQQKKMDSAFYFASSVAEYSKSGDLTSQMTAVDLMGKYYRAVSNTDSTLAYLERYYALKDSLMGNKVMEQAQTMAYDDMQRTKELAAQKAAFKNRLILYLISASAFFLLVLAFIFWRTKRKEQHAKELVQSQKEKLEDTLDKLRATQSQLIQSEKMASLGELTAGIAHEIQNPLNFVNNFSEVSNELIVEMNDELDKGDIDEAKAIASDISQNLEKINHHGKRAEAIVKGMLQHSQTSTGQKELTDINKLADEYLRLSYHGLRAKDKSFNATMQTDFDENIGSIKIIPQDIGRVILNLINNAFYAVNEKSKQRGQGYEPIVLVSTKRNEDKVLIRVKDNGNGISQKIVDKIYQPFFTTKPTGQGTGLGLSLSYDIIKAHGGEIKLETKEYKGSEFIIQIPKNA